MWLNWNILIIIVFVVVIVFFVVVVIMMMMIMIMISSSKWNIYKQRTCIVKIRARRVVQNSYIDDIHVETSQAKNYNNSDYKQFISQETKNKQTTTTTTAAAARATNNVGHHNFWITSLNNVSFSNILNNLYQ